MTIYSAARREGPHDRLARDGPGRDTPTGIGDERGAHRLRAPRVSGMSVGVPGTLRAWDDGAARVRHDRRCATRSQPGIDVAKRGFVVDPTFFAQRTPQRRYFADFPSTAALYLDPDGTPRDVGTVIRNPDLARTYKLIARQAPRASTAARSRRRS